MNFLPGPNFKYWNEKYLYITDNVYCTNVNIIDVSYGSYERYLFYLENDTYLLKRHHFSEVMYSIFGVVYSPDLSREIRDRLRV